MQTCFVYDDARYAIKNWMNLVPSVAFCEIQNIDEVGLDKGNSFSYYGRMPKTGSVYSFAFSAIPLNSNSPDKLARNFANWDKPSNRF